MEHDMGEHKPNPPSMEELMALPINDLEAHADSEIGPITIKIPPSQLAAVATALVGQIMDLEESNNPRLANLRERMTEAYATIVGQSMPKAAQGLDPMALLKMMKDHN